MAGGQAGDNDQGKGVRRQDTGPSQGRTIITSPPPLSIDGPPDLLKESPTTFRGPSALRAPLAAIGQG